jgi:hypothetical protein
MNLKSLAGKSGHTPFSALQKKLAKSKIAGIIISLNEFFGDFLCVKIAVAAKLTPKKLWKKRSKIQSRPFGRVCKATAAMLSWSQ